MSDTEQTGAPRAIVTGASAGIGAALARGLAGRGYELVLVARRADRLEALAKELAAAHGRAPEVVPLDLTRAEATAELLARVPHCDLLVNNAGEGRFGAALEIPAADQLLNVRLNCESLTALTLGYLPGMVARGRGVVLNLASIAGFQPVPYFAVYAATKAYVLHLSEALDAEVRDRGVRVMAVCPGPVPTEFQGRAGSPDAMLTPRIARRSADEVVEVCLSALDRPRPVVTPAPFHAFMRWAQRFIPRQTVVGMAARSMKKRLRGQEPA